MPKINSLEVVHQDTNKDSYQNLHDILVSLNQSLALDKEVVDGDARASIKNLLEMYANDKEAFLKSVQTLTTQFKNNEAKYEEEILLLAGQLAAQAKRTSTLSTKTESQFASVTEYAEAVSSEVARKTTTYSQDDAPTGSDFVYGDLWIDTNDNNRLYRWNGLVWIEASKVNTFRQTTAPTSASDGDLWYDTDDSNKLYRWNSITSTWDLTADARVAQTYARWGVQVDANGRVAGIQLNSDSTGTSEFTVLANAFRVYNTTTGTKDPTFAVVGGVVTPKNLQIQDSSGNYLLQCNTGGVDVRLYQPGMTRAYCSDLSGSGNALFAQGYGDVAIKGQALTNSSINHGVRGQNSYVGTSGLVGVQNGYDFYADGSGINYGPFTGAHDALMPKEYTAELGDIVVDTQCVLKSGMSNTLFVIEKTTTINQKGVVGVIARIGTLLKDVYPPAVFKNNDKITDDFGNEVNEYTPIYESLKDTHKVWVMNALGEGQVNVCGENGNISKGDLIVSSSIPGKGMKQDDDIIRSYTVAKAREDVTFNSPTEVKQVACIYLCG